MAINQAIIKQLEAKSKHRAYELALRAQEIAKTLHLSAPRDSVNKNSKGQQRSATLAAPDTGNLLSIMSQTPEETSKGYRVGLNYLPLEDGLKREIRGKTIERLKKE